MNKILKQLSRAGILAMLGYEIGEITHDHSKNNQNIVQYEQPKFVTKSYESPNTDILYFILGFILFILFIIAIRLFKFKRNVPETIQLQSL